LYLAAVDEVTDETFADEVLAAPEPVIVDFWARWCKPCEAIAPHLEAIATERGVRLVRMDIDANLGIPSRLGVLALPTVMLFVDGEPRATVYGAQLRKRYDEAFAPFLPGE
jgi:thioredoxin 1